MHAAGQRAVVIGGGPAGLVSAIALSRRGLRVTLVDSQRPPIDKACGEGLMPDGVRALESLGVNLTAAPHAKFSGIRFFDGEISVESNFCLRGQKCSGIGMRRTVLHTLLVEAAANAGVELLWGEPVSGISANSVSMRGRNLLADWIIGADGQQSRVRQWAGLDPGRSSTRFGFRQHLSKAPWSEKVEVYWCRGGEITVTPLAENLVCLAWVSKSSLVTLAELLMHAPLLAGRLGDAAELTGRRGSPTRMLRLRNVASGNVALVGEASGSVDSVTGEGMTLAFRQAMAVADAISAGNLDIYNREHPHIMSQARFMARVLLAMSGGRRFRRHAMRALSLAPGSFSRLLEFHLSGEKRLLADASMLRLAQHLILS